MGGFSTIGGGAGGSSQQVNFTIPVVASQTVSALYTAQNIVDVAGLLVAIQNTSGSPVVLTAASGSIVNTASFASVSTSTTVTIAPNATVVLETNLANLDYYIISASGITNITGGSAGQLLYQSAPSVTNFVAAGATGQYLQANGTGTPSWINPIALGVTGGAAGQVLYQSASNVTSFTATGTSGQVLVSNGAGAPTWATISGTNGTEVTNTGSNISVNSTRAYTLYTSGYTSNITMQDFLTAHSITDQDGNNYAVVNNTGSTYQLNLVNLTNGNSYSGNGTFLSGATINLAPNQTVYIQTFSVSTNAYTIASTSQTQDVGFFATLGAMGAVPASDTLINYTKVSDPLNWFDDTNHRWTPQKAGYYFIVATFTFQATGTSSNNNIQIRKNDVQVTINSWPTNGNTSSVPISGTGTAIVYLNGTTDYVTATVYSSSGGLTPNTGNWSTLTGMLVK